jgi:hypothetical protein
VAFDFGYRVLFAALLTDLLGPSTAEDFAEALGAEIPVDAVNVVHRGCLDSHCYHIELSFDASPEGVKEFTRNICGGVLRQGFDPLDAKYSLHDDPQYIEVFDDIYDYNVFANTSGAPDTIFGNVCRGSSHMIRVDKSDLELFKVQFLGTGAWCNEEYFPCHTYLIYDENAAETLRELGLELPADAADALSFSHLGFPFFAQLEFKAPPSSADQFSTEVCPDGLH